MLSPCARWEKAGQVSREVWEKAGEQGMLGVMIPEEHGGIGADLFSAAVLWEEQYVDLKMKWLNNEIKLFFKCLYSFVLQDVLQLLRPGFHTALWHYHALHIELWEQGTHWTLHPRDDCWEMHQRYRHDGARSGQVRSSAFLFFLNNHMRFVRSFDDPPSFYFQWSSRCEDIR